MKTEVLPVRLDKVQDHKSQDYQNVQRAAEELRRSDVPVAFPTETVYGLGADATRSAAVLGIYRAKQRPADNPLIVHIHSLTQLRRLLSPRPSEQSNGTLHTADDADQSSISNGTQHDPIPSIYNALIKKFWPGPLTMIMPNPTNSRLAPEVTAGLSTFGVRMPSNKLAHALIEAADVPVAAPSANSSSKPSPTTAEHVRYDLDGRIATILDGGPCAVGVESTVVNGLCDPPMILRPGGVGIDELRSCPGWENVQIGYKDMQEAGSKPLAPGMKYKHYSPKATVILFEAGTTMPSLEDMAQRGHSLGLIRTHRWVSVANLQISGADATQKKQVKLNGSDITRALEYALPLAADGRTLRVWELCLGPSAEDVAYGLFAALRELDLEDLEAIFVEGIADSGVGAAVMNRLRKAAEVKMGI